MNNTQLACVYLAVAIGLFIYLSSSTARRTLVLRRLPVLRRYVTRQSRGSDAAFYTKASETVHTSTATEYATSFPPSQRHVLPSIVSTLSSSQQQAFGDLSFDKEHFRESLLGWEENYQSCDGSKYVASGFSVAEIEDLGNFPDYSKLSKIPHPQPYENFDIDRALPRPYRPFRWPYHQTMSLSKLEPDWWLELESTYKSRIAERKALYQQHGKSVLAWLPGSELACKELMETALQYLTIRYPTYFTLHEDRYFENKILSATQDVYEKHALLVLLENIPEDFGIMLREPNTGLYHLRAGVICSALGWNLALKLGMPLHEIHGPIPDYKEKMQFSMDRFFAKFPTSKPIQRGSWGLEVDTPLYMPPGDPHEAHRTQQSPDLTLDQIHLRVDWQTLRRLPLSAAIIFNFKGLFTPVTEFRDEPGVPSLLLKILKDGQRNIMQYKNTWHVEHVILPKLEEWEQEQREKGLLDEGAGTDVSTLGDAPFFEGWEKKWRGRQGF